MFKQQPFRRRLSPTILALMIFICASTSADESKREKLHKIDQERQKLFKQIEQVRRNPALARMGLSRSLAELYKDLFMMDCDDPRTRLGAALAMKDVSDEQLVIIICDMVLSRKPTDKELQLAMQHMAEKKIKDKRKEAILDIVRALCNTKEFVEFIGK